MRPGAARSVVIPASCIACHGRVLADTILLQINSTNRRLINNMGVGEELALCSAEASWSGGQDETAWIQR